MSPDEATPPMVYKSDIFHLMKKKKPTVQQETEEEINSWEISS